MQDLPNLVLAFAQRHRDIYHPIEKLEADLVTFLQSQSFPGNVRELENDVQAMLFAKSSGTSLGLADWHRRPAEALAEEHPDLLGDAAAKVWGAISNQGIPYSQAIQQLERKVLQAALTVGGRTRKEIAQRLRTSERTLYHKIRAYDLRGQRPS
jgi:DNA-binding NtrC family response regulator